MLLLCSGWIQAPRGFGLGFACAGRIFAEDEEGRAVPGMGAVSRAACLALLALSVPGEVCGLALRRGSVVLLSGLQTLMESPGGGAMP